MYESSPETVACALRSVRLSKKVVSCVESSGLTAACAPKIGVANRKVVDLLFE